MLLEVFVQPIVQVSCTVLTFGTSATCLLIGAAFLLSMSYIFQGVRERTKNEPPIVRGLPFIGSGKDFQTNAVSFLQQCAKSYGNFFTLRLPVQTYLHVLMDPHSVEQFCQTKAFDFDLIQKQVNHNVFHFRIFNSNKMLREAAKAVNIKNAQQDLRFYTEQVRESLEIRKCDVPNGNWTQCTLYDLVFNTEFRAIFNSICGVSDNHAFNHKMLQSNFFIFHQYFTYMWLGLPVELMRPAYNAFQAIAKVHPSSEELLLRSDLSQYMRGAISRLLEEGQSETDIMGHNLVFMHVNYNTSKISHWIVNNLLIYPEAMSALRQEVFQAVASHQCGIKSEAVFNLRDLDKDVLPVLDSIIKETFRLSSGVFMMRQVSDACQFTTEDGTCYDIRKGDKVCFYPPAMHLDPEIFEDPHAFKYDRFINADFFKNGRKIAQPLLAYGTLCPGQRLSITQIKWFILSLINAFDLQLIGKPAEMNTTCYGHEILPHKRDCIVRYRIRPDSCSISFR